MDQLFRFSMSVIPNKRDCSHATFDSVFASELLLLATELL